MVTHRTPSQAYTHVDARSSGGSRSDGGSQQVKSIRPDVYKVHSKSLGALAAPSKLIQSPLPKVFRDSIEQFDTQISPGASGSGSGSLTGQYKSSPLNPDQYFSADSRHGETPSQAPPYRKKQRFQDSERQLDEYHQLGKTKATALYDSDLMHERTSDRPLDSHRKRARGEGSRRSSDKFVEEVGSRQFLARKGASKRSRPLHRHEPADSEEEVVDLTDDFEDNDMSMVRNGNTNGKGREKEASRKKPKVSSRPKGRKSEAEEHSLHRPLEPHSRSSWPTSKTKPLLASLEHEKGDTIEVDPEIIRNSFNSSEKEKTPDARHKVQESSSVEESPSAFFFSRKQLTPSVTSGTVENNTGLSGHRSIGATKRTSVLSRDHSALSREAMSQQDIPPSGSGHAKRASLPRVLNISMSPPATENNDFGKRSNIGSNYQSRSRDNYQKGDYASDEAEEKTRIKSEDVELEAEPQTRERLHTEQQENFSDNSKKSHKTDLWNSIGRERLYFRDDDLDDWEIPEPHKTVSRSAAQAPTATSAAIAPAPAPVSKPKIAKTEQSNTRRKSSKGSARKSRKYDYFSDDDDDEEEEEEEEEEEDRWNSPEYYGSESSDDNFDPAYRRNSRSHEDRYEISGKAHRPMSRSDYLNRVVLTKSAYDRPAEGTSSKKEVCHYCFRRKRVSSGRYNEATFICNSCWPITKAPHSRNKGVAKTGTSDSRDVKGSYSSARYADSTFSQNISSHNIPGIHSRSIDDSESESDRSEHRGESEGGYYSSPEEITIKPEIKHQNGESIFDTSFTESHETSERSRRERKPVREWWKGNARGGG